MKIGILTYFLDANPGTFLQAYSTCEALRKRFPNDQVELIDFYYHRPYFLPISLRTHLTIGTFIRDLKRYGIYKEVQKEYLATSREKLVTHDSKRVWEFINEQKYDLIVVGSDTILELQPFHFKQDSISPYWLPPEIRCKKVMCAASARALTIEQLNPNQRKACTESINGFDLVGVRDDATFALVKDLGLIEESKLQIVPDPTFSYDIDDSFAEKLISKKRLDFTKPTVAVNLPRILKPATELIAYYKSKGFQVISLGVAKCEIPCLTDISPFEWAGIFKHCRLVITYRFHDTLFSLKNLTPVIALEWAKFYVNDRGHSKYYSLLKQFDLHENNLVNTVDLKDAGKVIEVADKAMQDFDDRPLRYTLAQLRDQYNTYLDKATALLTKT